MSKEKHKGNILELDIENRVVTKMEERTIKHRLSEKEKVKAGTRLVDAIAQGDQLDDALAEYKAENKAAKERMESIAKIERLKLQTGYEHRKEECRVTIFPEQGWIRVARTSNGEIVEDRAMTQDEKETLPGLQ